MALTIHVGLTRKLGTANYGSIAASCAVDFEADAALLHGDLDGFQQHVGRAYAACRDAVRQELARQQNAEAPTNGNSLNAAIPAEAVAQPGADASAKPQNGNGHPVSEKQMSYLRQLAKQVDGLGVRRLDTLAQKMFGKPLAAASSLDASSLIDTLKAIKAGQIDLQAVLAGEAA